MSRVVCWLLLVFASVACASDASVVRARKPPLVFPVTFRFETLLFDVPLARAAEWTRAPQATTVTVAFSVDEKGLREKLEALARADESIVRAERAPLEQAPGLHARIARRKGDFFHPSTSLASDGVALGVQANLALGWQVCDLSLELSWLPDGGAPIRYPVSTPMPADLWLEFDLLPPQSSPSARAVIGFVRAVPVWPETGDL